MSQEMPQREGVVAFGPFNLFVAERRVEKSGATVKLGSRSLDILVALVKQAGCVVSKRDLLACVWPNSAVDESSLRVHLASLRKALGDGQDGARYITNVHGRGYCFVAPVSRPDHAMPSAPEIGNAGDDHRLPARLARMVGRDETLRSLLDEVTTRRFVMIVGPGGIGKTTVAVALGHVLRDEFAGAVFFIDLGAVSDSRLVPIVLATAFGIVVRSSDPTSVVLNYLRDRRMLLILDSCEHLIEGVAVLAESIFVEAPQVHIVATSRETLRVEGEHVHFLPPLATPPDSPDLTAAEIMSYPAAQLFIERAAAAGFCPAPHNTDVSTVARICRGLDGIALAIELAAGRVGAHGLQETAAMLDGRFQLLWRGRRTAVLRHQTLCDLLDWSYDLLNERDRLTLRRLSVFVGDFTREAARAVTTDADEPVHLDILSSLVSKSLVSAHAGPSAAQYRLLDTTRAYALEKLRESGEADAIARRHAAYYCEVLERNNATTESRTDGVPLANVRAALEWSYSESGDVELGIALVAASAQLLLDLSLLSECHRWIQRAIGALDASNRGTGREIDLQAALGLSMMYTEGNSDRALVAFTRGLDLAEQLGDVERQFILLGALQSFYERTGQINQALACARRGAAIARDIADPAGSAAPLAALGICQHYHGDLEEARAHLEAALRPSTQIRRSSVLHVDFCHSNRARLSLARTLWLQGYADQAIGTARQALDDAISRGHPVTVCIAIMGTLTMFYWLGDLARERAYIDHFAAIANEHSLEPYIAASLGMRGQLSVECGEAAAGIALLRRSLDVLHSHRYEALTTDFNLALVQGLTETGRTREALAIIDDALAGIECRGNRLLLPEVLRIKGNCLALLEEPQLAEQCYAHSLEVARRQTALSWELRTTTSLAKLRLGGDRRTEALRDLAAVYDRCTEGFWTPDLTTATQLLDGA